MFSIPRSIENSFQVLEGIRTCTLRYKGCVADSDVSPADRLAQVFPNLDGQNLLHDGKTWKVYTEGVDLVFSSTELDKDQILEFKGYVNDLLKTHVLIDTERVELARTLVDVTNADSLITETVNATVASFSNQLDAIGEHYVQDLLNSTELGRHEWIESLASVYATYYNKRELLDLIEFYRSDLGKKMISLTPAITKDCVTLAQNYAVILEGKMKERIDNIE